MRHLPERTSARAPALSVPRNSSTESGYEPAYCGGADEDDVLLPLPAGADKRYPNLERCGDEFGYGLSPVRVFDAHQAEASGVVPGGSCDGRESGLCAADGPAQVSVSDTGHQEEPGAVLTAGPHPDMGASPSSMCVAPFGSAACCVSMTRPPTSEHAADLTSAGGFVETPSCLIEAGAQMDTAASMEGTFAAAPMCNPSHVDTEILPPTTNMKVEEVVSAAMAGTCTSVLAEALAAAADAVHTSKSSTERGQKAADGSAATAAAIRTAAPTPRTRACRLAAASASIGAAGRISTDALLEEHAKARETLHAEWLALELRREAAADEERRQLRQEADAIADDQRRRMEELDLEWRELEASRLNLLRAEQASLRLRASERVAAQKAALASHKRTLERRVAAVTIQRIARARLRQRRAEVVRRRAEAEAAARQVAVAKARLDSIRRRSTLPSVCGAVAGFNEVATTSFEGARAVGTSACTCNRPLPASTEGVSRLGAGVRGADEDHLSAIVLRMLMDDLRNPSSSAAGGVNGSADALPRSVLGVALPGASSLRDAPAGKADGALSSCAPVETADGRTRHTGVLNIERAQFPGPADEGKPADALTPAPAEVAKGAASTCRAATPIQTAPEVASPTQTTAESTTSFRAGAHHGTFGRSYGRAADQSACGTATVAAFAAGIAIGVESIHTASMATGMESLIGPTTTTQPPVNTLCPGCSSNTVATQTDSAHRHSGFGVGAPRDADGPVTFDVPLASQQDGTSHPASGIECLDTTSAVRAQHDESNRAALQSIQQIHVPVPSAPSIAHAGSSLAETSSMRAQSQANGEQVALEHPCVRPDANAGLCESANTAGDSMVSIFTEDHNRRSSIATARADPRIEVLEALVKAIQPVEAIGREVAGQIMPQISTLLASRDAVGLRGASGGEVQRGAASDVEAATDGPARAAHLQSSGSSLGGDVPVLSRLRPSESMRVAREGHRRHAVPERRQDYGMRQPHKTRPTRRSGSYSPPVARRRPGAASNPRRERLPNAPGTKKVLGHVSDEDNSKAPADGPSAAVDVQGGIVGDQEGVLQSGSQAAVSAEGQSLSEGEIPHGQATGMHASLWGMGIPSCVALVPGMPPFPMAQPVAITAEASFSARSVRAPTPSSLPSVRTSTIPPQTHPYPPNELPYLQREGGGGTKLPSGQGPSAAPMRTDDNPAPQGNDGSRAAANFEYPMPAYTSSYELSDGEIPPPWWQSTSAC